VCDADDEQEIEHKTAMEADCIYTQNIDLDGYLLSPEVHDAIRKMARRHE
jgi:hypothetical protein